MKEMNRTFIKAMLCLFLGLLLCWSQASATDVVKSPGWGAEEIVESYTIGPGMKYTAYYYKEKPIRLWCVEVDLTNPMNSVEAAQSNDKVPHVARWTVPVFSRRNSREGHQVRAAINHDFFLYGEGVDIGCNVSKGEVTRIKTGRCTLGFSEDGSAGIFKAFNPSNGKDGCAFRCFAPDGTSVSLDSYNSMAVSGISGDAVFFNRMNGATLSAAGKYIRLQAIDDWTFNGPDVRCKVLAISDSPLQTSSNTCVLFLRNKKKKVFDEHLAVGDTMRVRQRVESSFWGTVPQRIIAAFNGNPPLIRNGVFQEDEYAGDRQFTCVDVAARTMAGLSRDKKTLYMVVTEASAYSVSVTCLDVARWMALHGANDVINFDGGGSSAVVVNHEMKNLPCRPTEGIRAVKSAMLAVSLAPTDKDVARISFNKPSLKVTTLTGTDLTVMAFNKYDEVLQDKVDDCTYDVEPASLGRVDDAGVFHATAVGKGKLIARRNGLVAEMPVTITKFRRASMLNAYAYALSATQNDGMVAVEYALNAPAISGAVSFYTPDGQCVHKVQLTEAQLTNGKHLLAVPVADLPAGKLLTWDVAVESSKISSVMYSAEKYKFYCPQGVAVDRNHESPHFGRLYVTESIAISSAAYHTGTAGNGVGQGVYLFTPDLKPVKNSSGKYGFRGGIAYTSKFSDGNYSYSPRKVRISADGRVFLSTQMIGAGSSLYEINPDKMNASFRKVFTGGVTNSSTYITTMGGKFMFAPNISFSLRGAGESLQLVALSGSKEGLNFNERGTHVNTYDLGTSKTWRTAATTTVEALTGKYTVSSYNTNISYDKDGGLWYVQYRSAPTNTYPAILHINADGEEDYRDIRTVAAGGGIAMSPDSTRVAIASGEAQVSVYTIVKKADGSLTLRRELSFATLIGRNCTDIAWDAADNLYLVGETGEYLRAVALPRKSNTSVTPCPPQASFTVLPTGIKNHTAGRAVRVAGNCIIAPDGLRMSVYTIDGLQIAEDVADILCRRGVYLVKCGNTVTKVSVR